MAMPSPERILLNNSSKAVVQDKKELAVGLSSLLMISGQKPQTTWAKKSISGFKLREGEPLGCKVTLRGRGMYTFLDRLAGIALPRARSSLTNHAITNLAAYDIGVGDPFQFYELEHHYHLFQSLRGFGIVVVMAPTRPLPSGTRAKGVLLWSGLQLLV
jgi:large subunit ribosomal protein L5